MRPLTRLALPMAGMLAAALVPMTGLGAAPGAGPEAAWRITSARPQSAEMRYGPILLPPAVGGAPATVNMALPATPMPCRDCYLTGVAVDMAYADGSSANLDTGPMLHHTVVFNSGRPDSTCGPDTALGQFGERFFAAGNERTPGELPAGFGYHLGSAPVRSIAEIMNHSAEPKTVFLVANMTHVPGSTPGMKAVTPVWMDENNCSTSQYRVPAGSSNRVARWTSTITGRVIAAGGHVHAGGLRTELANESTGEAMCASYAGYGTDPAYMGDVESMTTCIHDRIGAVSSGDVLTIDTYYDSPAAQDGVMGIMLAYVYETGDLSGGTPAPAQERPANNTPPQAPSGGHGGHTGH